MKEVNNLLQMVVMDKTSPDNVPAGVARSPMFDKLNIALPSFFCGVVITLLIVWIVKSRRKK